MTKLADELGSTRWSLIAQLKNWDDKTGWKLFFDAYWRLIYRTATRAGLMEAEAQEVVQETLLSIAKEINNFQADPALGSFKGWLLQITRRRIADQFRKRTPEERLPARRDDSSTGTGSTDRIPDPAEYQWARLWEEEWRQNLLDTALETVKPRVSPKQYKIFYLHIIKKQSAQSVCQAMNVNIGQVYLAKHRVSALLKKEVKRLEKTM